MPVFLTAAPFLKGRSSKIAYVSSNSNTSSSVSLPSHQTGDLIVIIAVNSSGSTYPTTPVGWFEAYSTTVFTPSWVIASKIAASSSETSGTWSGADYVVVMIWRGSSSSGYMYGTNGGASSVTSATLPSLTMAVTDNTSWMLTALVTGAGASPATPVGMVQRVNVNNGTVKVAVFDTAAGITAWSSQSISLGGTFNYRVVELEIKSL